jgi:acyl carrier protein
MDKQVNNPSEQGLGLVRQALARYTDTPVERIELDTVLADIQIDSLTLAELLFELEDRLGKDLSDTHEIPRRVSDVVALIVPHLDGDQLMQAA